MEKNVVKERLAFVHDWESGHWSITELCERYRVSRPTGYKWLARHEVSGGAGLHDRSRAPQHCPHRTTEAVEGLIVDARRAYGWGAKKLLRVLRTRYPSRSWPARSTVNAILERHTLLHKNRRRRKWAHPGTVPIATQRPPQAGDGPSRRQESPRAAAPLLTAPVGLKPIQFRTAPPKNPPK